MSASFDRESVDEVQVLVVRGRIGVDDLETLEEKLEDLAGATGERALLDLTACPFLASRAFPKLFRATQAMQAKDKRLLIACTQDLLRILEVLRLDGHLEVFPDRARAEEAATA